MINKSKLPPQLQEQLLTLDDEELEELYTAAAGIRETTGMSVADCVAQALFDIKTAQAREQQATLDELLDALEERVPPTPTATRGAWAMGSGDDSVAQWKAFLERHQTPDSDILENEKYIHAGYALAEAIVQSGLDVTDEVFEFVGMFYEAHARLAQQKEQQLKAKNRSPILGQRKSDPPLPDIALPRPPFGGAGAALRGADIRKLHTPGSVWNPTKKDKPKKKKKKRRFHMW